jgi:hemoglobin-like flavoprotein
MNRERAMTTTFNAAATKTVGVNATSFEFTFTRLERIAFGPGKITTLGAELERMGATRALVATGKTLGASPLLERVTPAMGRTAPACSRASSSMCRKFGTGPRRRGRAGRRQCAGRVRRRQPDQRLKGGRGLDDVAREFGIDLAIRRVDKRRHPMTPENQSLVRDSFAKVVPITPQAAAMFYDRLFVLDPSLQPLFKSDMTEQGRVLITRIGTVVANLGNLETIIPAVQDLGRRHATYGAQPRHYETVGAALLWTLEQGLGDAFTPPVKAAWTEAYAVLSSVMKKGADGSVASPSE